MESSILEIVVLWPSCLRLFTILVNEETVNLTHSLESGIQKWSMITYVPSNFPACAVAMINVAVILVSGSFALNVVKRNLSRWRRTQSFIVEMKLSPLEKDWIWQLLGDIEPAAIPSVMAWVNLPLTKTMLLLLSLCWLANLVRFFTFSSPTRPLTVL